MNHIDRPACVGCANLRRFEAIDGSRWDQCQIVQDALRYTSPGGHVSAAAMAADDWLLNGDFGVSASGPCPERALKADGPGNGAVANARA